MVGGVMEYIFTRKRRNNTPIAVWPGQQQAVAMIQQLKAKYQHRRHFQYSTASIVLGNAVQCIVSSYQHIDYAAHYRVIASLFHQR